VMIPHKIRDVMKWIQSLKSPLFCKEMAEIFYLFP
jgi:hypothetical protein